MSKNSHLNESNIALAQKNVDLAKQHIHQALRINPNYAEGYNNLGRIYYKEGDFKQAIFYLQKAIRLEPKLIQAHYNLAHSFSQLNQFDRATWHYQEVLRLSEKEGVLQSQAGAHLNLGLIFFGSDYEKVIVHLTQALELDSSLFNESTYLYFAEAYLAIGDALSAKKIYETALKIYPDSHTLVHNLAILYLNENNKAKALMNFKHALAQSPNNKTAAYLVQALNPEPKNAENGPKQAPVEYVRNLFDQYAEYYNQHVQNMLEYRLPFLLRDALGHYLNNKLYAGRVLDLGCGTGLCGIYFRDLALELTGVDISDKMIAQAQLLQGYDQLEVSEIEEYLSKKILERDELQNRNPNQNSGGSENSEEDSKWDLIIAGDVLVYFGNLASIFEKIKMNLKTKGHFIFSIETLLEDDLKKNNMESNMENNNIGNNINDFVLDATGRFKHHPNYIHALANKLGMKVLLEEDVIPRKNNNVDVQGKIFILG